MNIIFPGGGGNGADGAGRGERAGPQEQRLSVRSTRLGEGTLACPDCDAPVSPPGYPATITTALHCSWCERRGPLRDFLSLAQPTRPNRVVIRVTLPAPPAAAQRRPS